MFKQDFFEKKFKQQFPEAETVWQEEAKGKKARLKFPWNRYIACGHNIGFVRQGNPYYHNSKIFQYRWYSI